MWAEGSAHLAKGEAGLDSLPRLEVHFLPPPLQEAIRLAPMLVLVSEQQVLVLSLNRRLPLLELLPPVLEAAVQEAWDLLTQDLELRLAHQDAETWGRENSMEPLEKT